MIKNPEDLKYAKKREVEILEEIETFKKEIEFRQLLLDKLRNQMMDYEVFAQ